MADRHADARRIAREISSHFGNPLDFTLRLFLAGSKNIVIPDHVFLYKGKVKGLLRYTISTGGLFFDPQWPAIDVSQTAESLFSQKAVDVDMHLNQTIARHFASRLGPAMVFLPLLQDRNQQQQQQQSSSSSSEIDNNNTNKKDHLPNNNLDVEHIVTARYFSKECLFDVVGDLRASKASGILLEYRTPLDGYHNLLRATFTPFLLVMEMRKSNHSLKEHRVPLKLKVSTSAQNGSNLAKEVQVPQSASALACDMLNALVSKKEESGEFVERCVAYFSVISPRQVLFLWCTQMNVMPMEHANQLSEEVTCLNNTNNNNTTKSQQNNNNEGESSQGRSNHQSHQSRTTKSHQQQPESPSPISSSPTKKKKTASVSATVATGSSYYQHHPNNENDDDDMIMMKNNNINKNKKLSPSANSKNGKTKNNNSNVLMNNNTSKVHHHHDVTNNNNNSDQSFLSQQLLHDLNLSGANHRNTNHKNESHEVNENENNEFNATDEQHVVWDDSHADENYIREHSAIIQNLPSGYSAMRDEKKFVSSLQRVRENYDSPLRASPISKVKNNNADNRSNVDEKTEIIAAAAKTSATHESSDIVKNLATVAAARKVARMFGIAKQELPPRPKELDQFSKSTRSLEDYSASRTQHARKQTIAKRKKEDLDKLALALSRAKQRREEEQHRQAFYGGKNHHHHHHHHHHQNNKMKNHHHQGKKTIKKIIIVVKKSLKQVGNEEYYHDEEVEEEIEVEEEEEREEKDDDDDDLPPPPPPLNNVLSLSELPSAARDVDLMSDSEFDEYLSEIHEQTYDRFDCGMSGYVVDMPAHFIFSKYGRPHFNYGSSGGGIGGGSGKNNNNHGEPSSSSSATLLDHLLHPGSLRALKRKERHARNAPPLMMADDIGNTNNNTTSYIEQTVSSKAGQDLLSSRLLGAHHQARRKQQLEQELQRNNNNNNNKNVNNNRNNNSKQRPGSPSKKASPKNTNINNNNNNTKMMMKDPNSISSKSKSVSELMFNQLNTENNHHQRHQQKSLHHHHQTSLDNNSNSSESLQMEQQISAMNRFANENYRQRRKSSASRSQRLLSSSASKKSLVSTATGSSSPPQTQQQHRTPTKIYYNASGNNHHYYDTDNNNNNNNGEGTAPLDVMSYLNSTSATRMNRHNKNNNKNKNGRRSPSNESRSHQKQQRQPGRYYEDDEEFDNENYDDDDEDDDASSNASSNASEELMLETTAEPSNQTTSVMKTTGYNQQDASRLTYTVHKIKNLGQAIFQTAADLLYRACSHQAARRSIVEVVIPFGYRHLDQELRSTFLTLGLEEQPIENMLRITEFREQHENDGTSFGELALNTPIGDVQSMFDDDSFVRQSNGQIASLRDEWYSLEGGGSVVFVLHQAQTAVARAEKLLQTLEAELNPLARFDTPLCTPNDVMCCERLCELVDIRGFTICDAANVLVNERKQKQQQQQQQQMMMMAAAAATGNKRK